MNISNQDERNWYYYQINNIRKNLKNVKIQEISSPPKLDNDNLCFSFSHPTDEGSRSLIKQIKRIIEEAVQQNTHLLICSFILNNNEILQLLRKASSKLQGKIYIIVGNQQNAFISFDKEIKSIDMGFSSLVGDGILIRYVENAHLKFITNGKTALICSTNLTSEGLFWNPEFGIIIEEKNALIALNKLFFHLWFIKSSSFLINGTWVAISEKESINPYILNPLQLKQNNTAKIILTSKSVIDDINKSNDLVDKEVMYDKIVELINDAEKSIEIAMYGVYLASGDKFKKIKDILIKKADLIDVRILVPSVKVILSRDMRMTLEELKTNNIKIRYYKELHGKCIIIDNTKVLLMTGNIDNYLLRNNSYDIGYIIKESAVVSNFLTFYNHLWDEAAEECDANISINLHLDLSIRSYNLIAYKPLISVKRLDELIKNSQSIKLFLHENNCLLQVKRDQYLHVYFQLRDNQSTEFSGDTFNLTGIIDDKPNINLKMALSLSVEKLDLKLFWEG